MATEQHCFMISGEWLTNHIRNLMDEKKYSLAFKTASSLNAEGMTQAEKVELALGLMFNAKAIKDEPDGTLSVTDTQDVDVIDQLEHLFDTYEETFESISTDMSLLNRKLAAIYDAQLDSYPEALREACIYWMDVKRRDDPFLFGQDVSIPGPAIDAYRRSRPFEYDTKAAVNDVLGGDSPLASYLEVTTDEDDRPTYGWLDPDGNFHPVPWAQHQTWAQERLKAEDGITEFLYPADTLVARGWVLIHNPQHGVGISTMCKYRKLTLAQKGFLRDYYAQWDKPLAIDAITHNYCDKVKEFFDVVDLEPENHTMA